MSVILCAVGYDFGSRSIMAILLHMNLSAVFMICVISFPCCILASCSYGSCQCHLWDWAHLPFSPVLWYFSWNFIVHSQNLLIYFSHFSSIFLCPLFLFLPLQSLSNGHLSQEELYSANGTAFLLLANHWSLSCVQWRQRPSHPRDPVLSQQVCLQFICSQIIWHFFLAFAGLLL